jgi:hypothetical protein
LSIAFGAVAMRLIMPLAAALFAIAACATETQIDPGAAPAERDCFHNEDIRSFSLIDDHTIRVEVNHARAYALSTQPSVADLDFQRAIAVRSRGGWICTGRLNDVRIESGGTIPRTYVVDFITRIPFGTPAGS